MLSGDIWVSLSVSHALMVVLRSDPPQTILFVLPVGLFLVCFVPAIILVAPGTMVSLLAPWVAHLYQFLSCTELNGAIDCEGVAEGNSNIILVFV